jgi:hypothetical protein
VIIVETTLTADNADVLDGTDLANIPAGGLLTIHAASTQNDTLLTITGPGNEPVVRNQAAVQRANAEIREDVDPGYDLGVVQGGHYIVAVDVQTAATVRVRATFHDLQELGMA